MTEQPPWYDDLIKALAISQARNAASHQSIARHCRAIAEHLVVVAEQHETLAVYVPGGDQAAADLGTATDRHDINNLRTVVQGEQMLAQDHERQLHQVAADIIALAARVQALAAAPNATGRGEYEARAEAQRTEILERLDAIILPATPDDERDHGHDEMGRP